jgi:Tfp pilus assembly protein PilP
MTKTKIQNILTAAKTVKVFTLIVSMIILTFFWGCKKETPPPEPAKTQVSEPKKIEAEPLPVVQKDDEKEINSTYDPKDRRSPFKSLVQTEKMQTKEKKLIGTLESYDITDFRLVAIVQKGNENFALLESPDHKAYTARQGTVLGLHKGRVKKITSDKMVIIENREDYKGELKPVEVVLKLRKGEEE